MGYINKPKITMMYEFCLLRFIIMVTQDVEYFGIQQFKSLALYILTIYWFLCTSVSSGSFGFFAFPECVVFDMQCGTPVNSVQSNKSQSNIYKITLMKFWAQPQGGSKRKGKGFWGCSL